MKSREIPPKKGLFKAHSLLARQWTQLSRSWRLVTWLEASWCHGGTPSPHPNFNEIFMDFPYMGSTILWAFLQMGVALVIIYFRLGFS